MDFKTPIETKTQDTSADNYPKLFPKYLLDGQYLCFISLCPCKYTLTPQNHRSQKPSRRDPVPTP